MAKQSTQSGIERLKEAFDKDDYEVVCTEGGKLLEKTLKEVFLHALNAPYHERRELEKAEMRIAGENKGIDKFSLGELVQLFKQTKLLQRWTTQHEVMNPIFDSVDLSFFVNARNTAAHDNANKPDKETAQLFITFIEALFRALGEVAVTENAVPGQSGASNDPTLIADVFRLAGPLQEIIEEEQRCEGKINIRNIGLDMGVSWNMLASFLQQNPALSNIYYQGLLIDTKAIENSPVDISEDCRLTIELSAAKIKRFLDDGGTKLKDRKVSVEVRKNCMPPVIHGVSINDNHLFWSFSRLDEKGCITGGYDPFVYSTTEDPLGQHHLDVFNSWFNCWWANGSKI